MPQLANSERCCGCAACSNICPVQAIELLPDYEGFLQPVIDPQKCVECGRCENACPALAPAVKQNEAFKAKAYVVQHKDDAIRRQSTSGGAFTAIATEIIQRGGVVYGAQMGRDFYIKHGPVERVNDLALLRNSKYVQSDTGKCYKDVLKRLREDRWVCYSGTPCQINGLLKFLQKDYEKLITVDVCCKSVPSPMIFELYKEFKHSSYNQVKHIVFRDKYRGYSYCTMAHYKTDQDKEKGNSLYRRGSESDEWLRLFLSGQISRRSCFTCPYQTMQRPSDFTLWDRWETTGIAPEWNDNKGTTNVVVHTQKADIIFQSIASQIRFREYNIQSATGIVRENIMKLNHNRIQLFRDAHLLPATIFFKKYAPFNLSIKIKQMLRVVIWKLHLHNAIRRIKHLIIHRKH